MAFTALLAFGSMVHETANCSPTCLPHAEGTVKVHLHHIYRKLGIANRTALAVLAHTKILDAA